MMSWSIEFIAYVTKHIIKSMKYQLSSIEPHRENHAKKLPLWQLCPYKGKVLAVMAF
jgi:hypothetical protein